MVVARWWLLIETIERSASDWGSGRKDERKRGEGGVNSRWPVKQSSTRRRLDEEEEGATTTTTTTTRTSQKRCTKKRFIYFILIFNSSK
jgi:hypothetical protein